MTISVSPRVFISTPSAVACLRGIRNDRATSAAPRNLPAIAANRISPSCHRPSSPTAPTSTCRPATTKKTGNNSSRLICSSRSRISLVSAAAPLRGMIAPNTNAPKIACTPMTSVAQADSSSPARMTASMSGVSRPTERCQATRRASNGRTTRNITSTNATVSPMIRAAPAGSPPAATATTSASSDHPTTSFRAAQARANTPTWVRCMPRSVRIRASTGNAVIDSAMPMNSTNASGGTVCPSTTLCNGYSSRAIVVPSAKGSTSVPAAMAPAARSRPRIRDESSSSPTMNMNRTSPIWAITIRNGRTSAGKSS